MRNAWLLVWVALWCCTGLVRAQVSEATSALALNQEAALRASQAVVGTTPADYTFLNREGEPVRLSSFRGKPLLVSFIYTGCFQVCPTTTKSLQTALDAVRSAFGSSQFNVVSIGFNQPADSPQSLKSFALQYRIDAPNWDFLSPHASIVAPLTRDFGFSFLATPTGFDHTLQVTILDAEGKIYQQIYGETLAPQALAEPIRQALSATPVAPRFQMEDLIDRVKILCTEYDPQTGKYVVKYGLLIEIAGGVTFALFMLWFFLSEWLSQRRARRAAPSAAALSTLPMNGTQC